MKIFKKIKNFRNVSAVAPHTYDNIYLSSTESFCGGKYGLQDVADSLNYGNQEPNKFYEHDLMNDVWSVYSPNVWIFKYTACSFLVKLLKVTYM